MDSDEVTILHVESNTEVVYLHGSRPKRNSTKDKGNESSNISSRLVKKRRLEENDEDVIIVSEGPQVIKRDSLHFDKLHNTCADSASSIGEFTRTHELSTTQQIRSDDKQLALKYANHGTVFNSAQVVSSNVQIKSNKDQSMPNRSAQAESSNDQSVSSNTQVESSNISNNAQIDSTSAHVTNESANAPARAASQLDRTPKCWTVCPNCKPGESRRYHLIEVTHGNSEWRFVSDPLTEANFSVLRVKRIQNEMLWHRLMVEKSLMLREREDVNMQLLYHTSHAQPAIICEEGLDLRLSRNGNFGRGIYFSDNPVKCNCYWHQGTEPRQMFVCRVLLGHIKEYPSNQTDPSLVREPVKQFPKPGEPKTYDSVKGTLSGLNEFIVYNAYRVMPEYLIEYTALVAQPTMALLRPKGRAKHTKARKGKKQLALS